jgi:putative tricarboxylic transport membrane protein
MSIERVRRIPAQWVLAACTATVLMLLAGFSPGWAYQAAGPVIPLSYPSKTIDFIAPSSPGRGWDLTARLAARVLGEEKLVAVPITVTNVPGGNGAVTISNMVTRRKGDTHVMAVMGSALTGTLARRVVPYTFREITPVAAITGDYYIVAVRRDSVFNNLRTLIEVLRRDPGLVTVGGSLPAGSLNHLAVALLARHQGIDPAKVRYIAFGDAPSAVSAVLGGGATVLSAGLSETLGDIEAGRIRVLAVFAPERLAGALRSIPTAREQGIDFVFVNWRGFYMPPETPQDVVKFWERAFARMVKSKSWARILEERQWTRFVLTGDRLRKFLDEDLSKTQKVLLELGLLR